MMKVVIIGGRGNGTMIASVIEDCGKKGMDIECVGFLNDFDDKVMDYPVLGKIRDNSWKNLSDEYFFITGLSTVQKAIERYQLLNSLDIPLSRYATIIHPDSFIPDNFAIGKGSIIMPYAVVGPDVLIGNHVMMWNQSFIGQCSQIGDFAFIANNSTIGASVKAGIGVHIASNCSIRERTVIGDFAVVGLGSVVINNVNDYDVVVGNPAKTIRNLANT
jgi:acetyltransferase EpsM